MTTTTTTDSWGLQGTVGAVASPASWVASADAYLPRHQSVATKPMPSTHKVTILNGFHRRPSEVST